MVADLENIDVDLGRVVVDQMLLNVAPRSSRNRFEMEQAPGSHYPVSIDPAIGRRATRAYPIASLRR